MLGRRQQLGNAGEQAARRFLEASGCRILARNYRCPLGEIDLIVRDGDTLVFVEVKTRRSDADAAPEDNVNAFKQQQMLKAARFWLQQSRYPELAYRFDAVSVLLPESGDPQVRRIVEAFVPGR